MCISMNTNLYIIYDILLETVWWVFSNATLIIEISSIIPEIIANETFTVTDSLISWLFVITFVHPIYRYEYSSFRAFQHNLVCKNKSTGCEDTS